MHHAEGHPKWAPGGASRRSNGAGRRPPVAPRPDSRSLFFYTLPLDILA